MVSRAKSGYYPDSLIDAKDWEPVRPSLHKHNGRIVYEHLVVLPVVRLQIAFIPVAMLLRFYVDPVALEVFARHALRCYPKNPSAIG